LSKYLQTAREDERIRIARGIHDELGQVLTAIILETSWLAKKMTKRQTALKVSAEATVRLAKGAIHSVKRIIAALRPSLLSDLGLAEAIK
jgi:signal transduction histidine kinase